MESILFSIKEKRFVNRGFLNGPLCPVYGTGMVVILYVLEPFHNNILLLFVLGAILASALEFLTGFVLEKLFYTRWWDYTKKPFNINGYVCLENTLDWGILCVIMINFIQPVIQNIITHFDQAWLYSFASITFIVLIVDAIVTIANLLDLKQYVSSLSLIHNGLKDNEKIKLAYEKIHNNLEKKYITISQYLGEIKLLRETELSSLKERLDKVEHKSLLPRKQINRLYKNYRTTNENSKYKNILDSIKEDITNKSKK